MEVMEDIREIFAHNCRMLRGRFTQAEMAERADMPFPSYRNCEKGMIPKTPEALRKLAAAYGVSQARLFKDPEETPYSSRPTIHEALDVVAAFVKERASLPALNPYQRRLIDLTNRITDETEMAAIVDAVAVRVGEHSDLDQEKLRRKQSN